MKKIILLISMSVLVFSSDVSAQRMSKEEKVKFNMNRVGMKSHVPIFENLVQEMVDYHDLSLPLLIEMARDEEEDIEKRINATYIIGRMEGNAEKAVVTLTRILSSRKNDPVLKGVAAGALGRIGRYASPSVSVLGDHLYHNDPWVSHQSERALKLIKTRAAKEHLRNFEIAKRNQEQTGSKELVKPIITEEEGDKKDKKKRGKKGKEN